MQAYHQQIANLNLPNGSPAQGLLVATSQHQLNQPYQILQQQQQQLQQQHPNNTYQDLVKAYLPQFTASSQSSSSSSVAAQSSSSSTNSFSNLASLGQAAAKPTPPSMTSFAVRLMSLNAHELRCLNSDSELMRCIGEAQSLIENRLQDINATDQRRGPTGADAKTQQAVIAPHLNYTFQPTSQQQQEQHLMHLTSQADNYYQNVYNLQQQHHQQQQLLLLASRYTGGNEQANANANTGGQQQQQLQLLPNHTTTSNLITSLSGHPMVVGPLNSTTLQGIIQQQQQGPQQNGLDLRTTPRPTSAISTTPSPNRAGSTGSGNSARSLAASQHPKKLKLTEYRRLQQLAEQASGRQYQEVASESNENDPNIVNESPQTHTHTAQQQQQGLNKRTYHDDEMASVFTSNVANTRSTLKGTLAAANVGAPAQHAIKKYKGEFDEPSHEEVVERERQLHKPGHYHSQALKRGECACVIGSEFRDRTRREALELLERWRSLDTDERVKWKWDVADLPRDIPLSDIKKFEDLRRDYSQGRADFGGASKRKPLSIRGTRQFLLMLYCLHGHPGREDPMQKEGYCPHCFAKIRTENEQSTLVRVVNHFNMKHRRGANPRLSPHLETTTTTTSNAAPQQRGTPAASPPAPSPIQIRETLMSMVESAVASVEVERNEAGAADSAEGGPPVVKQEPEEERKPEAGPAASDQKRPNVKQEAAEQEEPKSDH